MKNKYSLKSTSYDIDKAKWKEIKDAVVKDNLTSQQASKRFDLNQKQLWFLYDVLLQEKYNSLYEREKLVNPKVGDYVYCDAEGFGRGEVTRLCKYENIIEVKFVKRELPILCNSEFQSRITRL